MRETGLVLILSHFHEVTVVEWANWFLSLCWLQWCCSVLFFSGKLRTLLWAMSLMSQTTFGPHLLLQCRLNAVVFWLCVTTMRLQKWQINPSWVIYHLCWQFWSVWKFHSLSQSRPVIEPNNFVLCLSPLNKQCRCNLHLIGSLCFGW